MNEETLKKANELAEKLKYCKCNLRQIKYTQNEEVLIRSSYLRFNGSGGDIEIPKSLFRVIGKLIECEYESEINKLEKEFNEL